MSFINSILTVNGGVIKEYKIPDPLNQSIALKLEILYPKFHNPHYEIICYYYRDKEGRKIELTISRNIKTRAYSSEVYYFKHVNDLHHYRSRQYPNFINMPSKYYDIVKYLHAAFIQEFGN